MTTRLKIIVSDSSVLMDLAKVRLLEATVALPFEFMIPDVMLATELLDLGSYHPSELVGLGFRKGQLDGTGTRQASIYFRQHRQHLSLNDCFAWRLAERHAGILMTGDGKLRQIASSAGVEVHGTLWAIELMMKHATCPRDRLIEALDCLDRDPLVRLPKSALRALRSKFVAGR